MKTKKPLVSVIMPVYNAGMFLRQSVGSIINQTYTNWELIAIDDASKDDSYKILRNLARTDSRIKVSRNKKNLGIGDTMNKLLTLSRGKFIARADADDICYPHRLEKQVQYLQENKHVALVGSFMAEINEKNEMTAARKVPLTHDVISSEMFVTQTIQNPTLFFRKDRIPVSELWFDNSLSPVDDLDFYFRLLKHVTFANIPEYLVAYRKHTSNASLTNIKQTFSLTWQTRMKALREYRYKPGIQQYFLHLTQKCVVDFLPNSLLYSIFKFWKHDRIGARSLFIQKIEQQPKRKFGISVILPVYRGELIIRENLVRLHTYLRSQHRPFEIIVVVDGNVDQTEQIAKKVSRTLGKIRVFAFKENKGKGSAVRHGLLQAKYEYAGFIDAGSDIDYYSLGFMLNEINNYPHISTFIADKRHLLSLCQEIPLIRKLCSTAFRTYINSVLGTHFSDTQAGLKFFKKSIAHEVINSLPYSINRFAFDVELLKELHDRGYAIHSCPVVIKNEYKKSLVQIFDIFNMAFDVTLLGYYYYSKKFISLLESILVSPKKAILTR